MLTTLDDSTPSLIQHSFREWYMSDYRGLSVLSFIIKHHLYPHANICTDQVLIFLILIEERMKTDMNQIVPTGPHINIFHFCGEGGRLEQQTTLVVLWNYVN